VRRLTFRGYLESYVQLLAGQSTLALPRLAALTHSEPRLTEPLVLWAVETGHASRLSRLLKAPDDLERELATLVSLEQQGTLESALAAEDPRLRPEYTKVWRSYVARRDAHTRDAQLKLEARKRALALETSKGVSRYRMAKDLGLNPGNLHAFLAQGNATKLSLDRAFELVRYLEAAGRGASAAV
jgi:hypothetical protein